MKVSIIGGGSFGTTLAQVLYDNNHEALVYDINNDFVTNLNNNHLHPFFNDVYLDKRVKGTTSLIEAINYSDILLIALPTKVIRQVLKDINKLLKSKKLFISVSKGIEPDTKCLISEIINQEIKHEFLKGFVFLTGPSHAEELVLRKLTCLVSVSNNLENALFVQKLFNNKEYLRVYRGNDLIGSQVSSAIKNAIAVVSGMATGYGLGENARSALISRGILEIAKVVEVKGGKKETAFGLTGIGDLIVTASSLNSRNFQAGLKIGQGYTKEEVLNESKMVVEGFRTILATYEIKQEYNLDLPIIEAAYKVLYENANVKDQLYELLSRDLKQE